MTDSEKDLLFAIAFSVLIGGMIQLHIYGMAAGVFSATLFSILLWIGHEVRK